jgi:tetratricopeptide (TPR) repeat protein
MRDLAPPRRLAGPRGRALRGLGGFAGLALAAAAVLVGAAVPAFAEEPWERAIREGILEQDARIQQTGLKHLIARLEASAHRDPSLLNVYFLSRAYGKAKQYDDALAEYGEVLKLEARCYFAHRDVGMIHYEVATSTTPPDAARLARAEASLEQARRLKPDYADALRPLADVRMLRKDYAGAATVLQSLLDAVPADNTARVKLVEVQHMAGRLDDALRGVSVLLAKEPRNPALRHLQARILVDKGDHARAAEIFRDLALENPDARPPVDGYLFAMAKKSPQATLDEFLWGLERLLRLARTPEDQRRISGEIQRLRTARAEKSAPEGPPDVAAQVRLLNDPDEGRRLSILRWLWSPGPPEGTLDLSVLREGLLRRLVPAYEPVAAHRKWALRLIAKYGGPALVAPIRHSLRDPDPEVRLVAVDTVAELKNLAGVAALADPATGADLPLASAARRAVYRLANAPVPDVPETPEAQAQAFRTWWTSPQVADLKRRVIAAVISTQDHLAEQLLVPFVAERDPAVARTAYEGLREVAAALGRRLVGPRADWMRTFPVLRDASFEGPGADASRAAVAAWWARRPQ